MAFPPPWLPGSPALLGRLQPPDTGALAQHGPRSRAATAPGPCPPVPYRRRGERPGAGRPSPGPALPGGAGAGARPAELPGGALVGARVPVPPRHGRARALLLEKFYFAFVWRNIICCKLFCNESGILVIIKDFNQATPEPSFASPACGRVLAPGAGRRRGPSAPPGSPFGQEEFKGCEECGLLCWELFFLTPKFPVPIPPRSATFASSPPPARGAHDGGSVTPTCFPPPGWTPPAVPPHGRSVPGQGAPSQSRGGSAGGAARCSGSRVRAAVLAKSSAREASWAPASSAGDDPGTLNPLPATHRELLPARKTRLSSWVASWRLGGDRFVFLGPPARRCRGCLQLGGRAQPSLRPDVSPELLPALFSSSPPPPSTDPVPAPGRLPSAVSCCPRKPRRPWERHRGAAGGYGHRQEPWGGHGGGVPRAGSVAGT